MPISIPVAKLLSRANPLGANPWNAPIKPTFKTIKQAITQNCFQARPLTENLTPNYHSERIAFLVEQGWTVPIEVEVGVPGYGKPNWIVEDGNHRLAAADYRKDAWISAEV